MQLVSPLAAGIRGAENGTAEVYNRLGSARIGYYQGDGGFEAQNPKAAGTTISLDQHGSAVVYVSQLAQVIVKDDGGSVVRTFTVGEYDANVEVISPSFTGTSYDTGASGTNKPTTLEKALDSWLASGGAPDFLVRLAGSDVTLQSALASVHGFFYNVQDPAYGAVGDGTVDDTAAITAAINAASAVGGGIVWFPPGTYRCTSTVTWKAKVHLLGSGSHSTNVSIDHATFGLFENDSGANNDRWMSGLALSAAQTNAGGLVRFVSASDARFIDIIFSGVNVTTAQGLVYTLTTGTVRATFEHCKFFLNGGTATRAFVANEADVYDQHGWFTDCRFMSIAAGYTVSLLSARYLRLTNCFFDLTANNQDLVLIKGNGATGNASVLSVEGCTMSDTLSGNPVMVEPGDYEDVYLSGNYYGDGCEALPSDAEEGDEGRIRNLDRIGRLQEVTVTTDPATATVDAANYDSVLVIGDDAAEDVALAAAAVLPGEKLSVVVHNSTASDMDLVSSATVGHGALTIPSPGGWYSAEFICVDRGEGGGLRWQKVGGQFLSGTDA